MNAFELNSKILRLFLAAFALTLSVEASAAPRVFVLIGGFGSCAVSGSPNSMWLNKPFVKVLAEILAPTTAGEENIEKPLVYKGCYGYDNYTLYYQTPDGKSLRGNNADLIRELKALPAESSMNFIGHSHGAWTAMVASLALAAAKIENLITIDPISMLNCSRNKWLASTYRVVFGGEIFEGCASPPQDLERFIPQLKSRVNFWLNAWQDEFTYLHSGPMLDANENLHLTTFINDGYWHPAWGHQQIIHSPELWRRVETLLK